MKDLMIGCCGLDCGDCDARRATLADDDELRRQVACQWCELNHTDQILPEHINCLGCRPAEGPKTVFCTSMCEVRKCAFGRGFETCGDCPEMEGCPRLAVFTSRYPELKENLLRR